MHPSRFNFIEVWLGLEDVNHWRAVTPISRSTILLQLTPGWWVFMILATFRLQQADRWVVNFMFFFVFSSLKKPVSFWIIVTILRYLESAATTLFQKNFQWKVVRKIAVKKMMLLWMKMKILKLKVKNQDPVVVSVVCFPTHPKSPCTISHQTQIQHHSSITI